MSGNFDEGPSLGRDLARLESQFEAIEEDARDLLSGLDDEQRTWRPAPGRWSITECLDHLNTVGYQLLPRLDRVVAEGHSHPPEKRRRFRPRVLARLLVRWMEPPYRIRLRRPAGYRTPPPGDPERVERDFIELQSELIKRLYDADGVDLNRPRMPSPANPRLKLSLGEWFAFLAAHERRHLWQARQVQRQPGFPT